MELSVRKKVNLLGSSAATFRATEGMVRELLQLGFENAKSRKTFQFILVGLVTSYFHPFTAQAGGSLDSDFVPEEFKKFHSQLRFFRNKLYAHVDADAEIPEGDYEGDYEGLPANITSVMLSPEGCGFKRVVYPMEEGHLKSIMQVCSGLASKCEKEVAELLEGRLSQICGELKNGEEVEMVVNVGLPDNAEPLVEINSYKDVLERTLILE